MVKTLASIALVILVSSTGVRAGDPSSSPTPNLERLRRLEAFTRTIPPHRLSLNVWASSLDIQDPNQDPDSKSYGCVAAWSTQLFAGEGFRLRRPSSSVPITVTYRGLDGLLACKKFFGVSYADAASMFYSVGYNRNPAGAADAIAGVIRRHESNFANLSQVLAPSPTISLASGR